MEIIRKLDGFVKKKLVWLILLFVALGFVFGIYTNKNTLNALKSLIMPTAFIMLWASMIDLKIRKIVDSFKFPKQLVLGNILALVIAPLIMLPIALFFAKNGKVYAGLMLAGIAPPGGFITYWSMLLEANMGLAVAITLTTFLVSLVWIPYGMKLFVGNKVNVATGFLFNKIFVLVVYPFILAVGTRFLIIKLKGEKGLEKIKPSYHLLSSIMALFLVFTGVALKSEFILQHPSIVLLPAVGAFIYYLFAYPLAYAITRWVFKMNISDTIPLVYGTATKNLSIGMALAAAAFGPLTLMGVIVCMLFQMPLASVWYKIFLKLKNKEKLGQVVLDGEEKIITKIKE